jgi:predicted ATP-dependent endonuclease of OLD family
MPQYITIKNFGPITSIEKMEVKDFMLFIGERSTGKSTIAKLIYFFKAIDDDVYSSLYSFYQFNASGNFEHSLKSQIWNKFNETFSQVVKILNAKEDFEVIFHYKALDSENYVRINKGGVLFGRTLKKLNDDSIEEIKSLLKPSEERNHDKLQQMQKDFFFKKLFGQISETYNVINCAYIPAQRVALAANISDKSYSDFRDVVSEDFKDLLQNFRSSFNRDESDSTLLQILKNYEKLILRGNEISIKFGGRDSLKLENGKEIPLVSASSGFQEIGWFFVVLKYLASRKYSTFVVTEEPESHLDPKGQSLMMEAIVAFGNHKIDQKPNQVIVTTHSPYILATVNNLMYAYKVSQEHLADVSKVIDKSLWLDPRRVGAYECREDEIINLIAEDGLIKNEKLDEMASIDINRINNNLFAIQNEAVDEL